MSTDSAPKWRRLEPDERKEQIFECAASLFGERPYAAVSTSDIATQAGVARGLINHYFGTKRELYLEVIRQALTVPHFAVELLPSGSLETRADAAIEWFLDMVVRQQRTWLAAISPEGIGKDSELERILAQADRESADRVLEAIGLSQTHPNREQFNALVRAYGGMVKAAGREWLIRETLSRQQVHVLLSKTLLAIVNDVFPTLEDGARP